MVSSTGKDRFSRRTSIETALDRIEEHNRQEIRPIKEAATRIDGGTALILALAMLLRQPPEPEAPSYDIFVVNRSRGPERGWSHLS